MARNSPEWPNVERQLAAWLAAGTGRPVYTETDDDLEAHLPAHRIARVGGGGGPELDKVVQVEVETIAPDRPSLWAEVQKVETAMFRLSANGTDDWYVDTVTETFAAAIHEADGGSTRKASATYALTLRPQ